jgi:hypothetical protein
MMRRHFHRVLQAFALVAALALASLNTGCATTGARAYQREHLADPIVSFQAEAKREARLMKSLEAREGSTGGNGGAGGGCACK